MPFKKCKNGKYRSPTGKMLTKEQVKAYYAKMSDTIKGRKKSNGS